MSVNEATNNIQGLEPESAEGQSAIKPCQLQVIDENQEFTPELTNYIKEKWHLDQAGFDYNLVAVFGSQSTGKSTLLNALFQTGFDTMSESIRQQTTKGLWMSLAADSNTLVMDVEGVDGRERGEDQDFERKSALFSMAVSQVILINMWENQVGLYNGANMGLLKTVFEVNLELFQQKGKGKTLLFFVIRDHIGKVPLSQLSETIKQDLSKAWSELAKPKGLETSSITDFFDFMFFGLPHKVLLPDEFEDQVQLLRACFYDSKHQSYAFRQQYHKRIPADGFQRYAEQIWQQIITDKSLDLPTQQQLLAQFRCDEIAAVQNNLLQTNFAIHRTAIEAGEIVEGLGKIFKSLKDTALQAFDTEASRYHQEVYKKKRNELDTKIDDYFHAYFRSQLTGLTQKIYNDFVKAIESGLKATDYDFKQLTTTQASEAKEKFLTLAKATTIEGSTWSIAKEEQNLANNLDEFIIVKRVDELKKLDSKLIQSSAAVFDDELSPLFNTSKKDLWTLALHLFKEETEQSTAILVERATEFGLTSTERDQKVGNLRVKLWEAFVRKCKEETADVALLSKLRYRLEEHFRYDQDGLPKVWKPEDDIDAQFKFAKTKALELLPFLVKIDTSEAPINFTNFFKDASEDLDFQRSLVIVPSSKQSEIDTRFKRESDALFIEAKRSIVATTAEIPYWIMVLLLVLGWNEILFVITNPLLLTFSILVGALFYALWVLKLMGPITTFLNLIQNEIKKLVRNALQEQGETNAIPLLPLRNTNSTTAEMDTDPTSSNELPTRSRTSILNKEETQDLRRMKTMSYPNRKASHPDFDPTKGFSTVKVKSTLED